MDEFDSEGPENEHSSTIGYQSPPKRTRFRKGRSGNPKGRPKKRYGMDDALLNVLQMKISNSKTQKKITIFEALCRRCGELAVAGNPRAIRLLDKLSSETARWVPTFNTAPLVQVDTTEAKRKLAEIMGVKIPDADEKGLPDDL